MTTGSIRATRSSKDGFTLIELLVVMAILAVLAGLLLPAVRSGYQAALRSACSNNLRQLAIANHAYAADHGRFVAGAPDIWSRNLIRWHGTRTKSSQPFDPQQGPLSVYLGETRQIKECPAFRTAEPGFEAGCGGYGYNTTGVGSESYMAGTYLGAPLGMVPEKIHDPGATVMFADCAFLESKKSGVRLIEYSFAEPHFLLSDREPKESYRAMPTIHFRHQDRANVAWVDGHVSSEVLNSSYSEVHRSYQIGWFGPDDNTIFDPN